MIRFCDLIEAAGAEDPEFTSLRFFRAIDRRAWLHAVTMTSAGFRAEWSEEAKGAVRALRGYWKGSRIESVTFIDRIDTESNNPDLPGVALTTLVLRIQISGRTKTKGPVPSGRYTDLGETDFAMNLIRETSAGIADPQAPWRVVPNSLREAEGVTS